MYNILYKTNQSLLSKTFSNGLSSYTQSNCQVTLTNDGYRIYRPPNKTPSTDGNTMWGGFVAYPFNADNNALQKNHTYVIKFDLKGKTSGAVTDINWSNNVGWGGGGLSPSPTNISKVSISANWQSEDWYPWQWIFKITDDIYKVCTKSYSSFVEGETYLSYKGFKFGFEYVSTGEMGTDLYIRNIRLYDITTQANEHKLNSTGVFDTGNLVECTNNSSLKIDGDIYMNNFIEW